jgi:hypothetical protein
MTLQQKKGKKELLQGSIRADCRMRAVCRPLTELSPSNGSQRSKQILIHQRQDPVIELMPPQMKIMVLEDASGLDT